MVAIIKKPDNDTQCEKFSKSIAVLSITPELKIGNIKKLIAFCMRPFLRIKGKKIGAKARIVLPIKPSEIMCTKTS
jgi:hypothetical protein